MKNMITRNVTVKTLLLAPLLLSLSIGISQAFAQSATSPRKVCTEGRLADGKTCIPSKMAEAARNKAIMIANARVSHTGPAQPPSLDAIYLDRPLAARLFGFNARHSSFGR